MCYIVKFPFAELYKKCKKFCQNTYKQYMKTFYQAIEVRKNLNSNLFVRLWKNFPQAWIYKYIAFILIF